MKTLREEVARILPEAIEMRRHLHSHPELPGQSLHSPTFVPHEASLKTALLLLTAAAVSE
jgi:metal-dependent amidase/aminoacylase/carboxypeptidase family protein